MSFDFSAIPEALQASAYSSGEEYAWSSKDALKVIDYCERHGMGAVGVEVWLPTKPSPTIPAPIIYGWSAEDFSGRGDAAQKYLSRCNEAARKYISQFAWDPKDQGKYTMEPFFNLEIFSPDELL